MGEISVLHIITGLGCGGAEHMLLRLTRVHQSFGVKSTVISLTTLNAVGVKLQASDIEVIYLDGRSGRYPRLTLIADLINVSRRIKPDLIQGWMYHGNIAASIAQFALRKPTPVIWSIRQSLGSLSDERPLTRGIIKLGALMSRKANRIIYNSRESARQHEQRGFHRTRTIFIPNGFITEEHNSEEKQEIRKNFPTRTIKSGAVILGHAARFHPKKGHDVLFNAFDLVLKQGWDVHLVVAGRDVALGNDELWKSKLGELPAERYSLLGEVNDMKAFYDSLDIFVSSSKWGEGFPNVIAEAMANKVPCVGTDVGETSNLIGDTGVVVPSNDIQALADGIIYVLKASEESRLMWGTRAAERVQSEFNIDSVGKKFLNVYREELSVVSKPGG